MDNWLAKNETYINPRTAQMLRIRLNQIEEARKKVEKDVEFRKIGGETEAEKLIKKFGI